MNLTVVSNNGYELLSAAIIRQAVMDYEHGREMQRRRIINCPGYNDGTREINEVKAFFHSNWFTQLSNEDGPGLFKKIKENYDKYGTCMPFKKKEDE